METGCSIVPKPVIIFFRRANTRACLVAICQVIAANCNSKARTANSKTIAAQF